jgi:soluble lytic murein transglycosylase-like protein
MFRLPFFSVPACLCGENMRRLAGAGLLALAPALCWAGAQQYEPLAASVQAALHSAVADRASPRLVFASPDAAMEWLDDMSIRLARRIPDQQTRLDLLTTVQYEAKRAGLDPQLVLGIIEVESAFRKYAVSRAGARGYMQVMPFWAELIGTADHNLFHLRTNLRYGCVILRHYLDIERGDLARALARYNGSLGKKSSYAAKVMKAWETRWAWPAPQVTRAAYPDRPTRYVGGTE